MLLGIRWGNLRTKIVLWSLVPAIIVLIALALVTYWTLTTVRDGIEIIANRANVNPS